MRTIIRVIQLLVGILFILSGLVKANDPQGLGFKMQEFFEIWNADLATGGFFAKNALIGLFEFLHGHALFLSVVMITLEIMAGIALLLGWRKKFVLWLLMILMVFFTFLTAYAYFATNPGGAPKFTNCGCFGDCLPLEPATSFWKDVVLVVLIGVLIWGRKHLFTIFTVKRQHFILIISLALSLILQWWVLNYLPLVDCLPFKKGNNLPEKMKPPKDAVPSEYETRMIYRNAATGEKKDMSLDEFNSSKIWEDASWKWDTTITKLIKKGNDIPEIQGFSLAGKAGDSTDAVLALPVAVLGFGMEGVGKGWLSDFKELKQIADSRQIPVFFTTNNPVYFEKLFADNGVPMSVFSTDFTIIRTAARTNPAFYLLKNGTVVNKYSYRQIDDLARAIQQP